MAKISLIVSIGLLALFVKDAEPLQCWTCSSNLTSLCNDPMDAKAPADFLFKLKDCESNPDNSSKAACKKQLNTVDGKTVIIRGCTWKRSDDNSTACPTTTTKSNEVIKFCETCDTDGCNGAATIGRTLALLVAPLSLLLFKMF